MKNIKQFLKNYFSRKIESVFIKVKKWDPSIQNFYEEYELKKEYADTLKDLKFLMTNM
ncbi:MAG: hypothetical protein ACE5KE_07970 [Methanosarcinales archaeon]